MLPLIFINNIKINNMENKQIKCYCGHTIYCDCGPLEEPKQETLEEAIKREYETRKFNSDFPFDPQSFKLGAKWQEEQERMYSEEEVIKIVEKSRETGLTAEYLLLTEQFKKQ